MGPVRQNPIQRTVSLFICVCIALCTIVAHNIAQNRPDSFSPYPPDNHHCSDDVYLREGGISSSRSSSSRLVAPSVVSFSQQTMAIHTHFCPSSYSNCLFMCICFIMCFAIYSHQLVLFSRYVFIILIPLYQFQQTIKGPFISPRLQWTELN